jgi:hypothetical protein
MEVFMAINPPFRLKKKLDLKEHGKKLLNQKLKPLLNKLKIHSTMI